MASLPTPLTLIHEIEDVAITTADKKLNLPISKPLGIDPQTKLSDRSRRSGRSIGISTLWFLLVKIPIIVIVLLITCAWLCLQGRKKKEVVK